MAISRESITMSKQLKFQADAKSKIYWNNKTSSYHYRSSDRKLSRQQVDKIVSKEIKRNEGKIEKLTNRFINGNINFEAWQKQMSTLVRDSHVNLLRFGRGGKENTYAIHYLEMGNDLRKVQYPALRNFSREIKNGRLSKPQMLARSALYARSSKIGFETGNLYTQQDKGYAEGKRHLGSSCEDHCPQCLYYATLGFVSLSDLILPTQKCDCNVNCCCSIEFR